MLRRTKNVLRRCEVDAIGVAQVGEFAAAGPGCLGTVVDLPVSVSDSGERQDGGAEDVHPRFLSRS